MEESKCGCRFKNTPRSEKTVAALQSRLNRIIGQVGGIKKMLDDGRYCDDILVQLSAVKLVLSKKFQKAILKLWMNFSRQ